MKYGALFSLFSLSFLSRIFAFTGDIGKTSFTFDIDAIFPTPRALPTDNGIDNIADFMIGLVPFFGTVIAMGAVMMVVLGGFHMVLGGASSEQTEKGKGIIKDALLGLTLGLLAYVIIVTIGNILDV